MRLVPLTFILSTVFSSYAALAVRVVDVNRTGVVDLDVDTIVEVLTDYGNTCDNKKSSQNCRYYGKDIKTSVVLESSEDRILFWQYVKARRDSRQFVVTEIERNLDGSVLLVSKFPSKDEIQQLTLDLMNQSAPDGSSYVHKSPMTGVDVIWVLTPLDQGGTEVSVEIRAEHNIRFGAIADGFIRGSLNQSLQDYFGNLAKYEASL